MLFNFFFFKQKTAYEMRISDWSSDVCSSDLAAKPPRRAPSHGGARAIPSAPPCTSSASPNRPHREIFAIKDRKFTCVTAFGTAGGWSGTMEHHVTLQVWGAGFALAEDVRRIRSEEHTSELQSLMRSSYAVFCS